MYCIFVVGECILLVIVMCVYCELEEMGLVSGEIGCGIFVCDFLLFLGYGVDQQVVVVDVVDFNFNYFLLLEQGDVLCEVFRQLVMVGDIDLYLCYQFYVGWFVEWDIIVCYLICQYFVLDVENVLIVNGVQYGLVVIVMGLLCLGDVVVVDVLIYLGFKILVVLYYLELVVIFCWLEGLDLWVFQMLCQQWWVWVVYIMLMLYNLLGWVFNIGQWQVLVDFVCQYDLLIIEDVVYVWLVSCLLLLVVSYVLERMVYVIGFLKNIVIGLCVGVVIFLLCYCLEIECVIWVMMWNMLMLISLLICVWIEDGMVVCFEMQKCQDV